MEMATEMEMEEVKIATEIEIKVAWMETAMEMEIMEVKMATAMEMVIIDQLY